MNSPSNVLRGLVAAGFMTISATALMAQTAPSPSAPNAPSTTMPASPSPMATPEATEMFVTTAATPGQMLGSDLDDKTVYNLQDEKIGEIDDVLIDADGKINAVVVGVGGFLGLGKKDVAVNFKSFKMVRQNDGETKIVLDVAKAALQNAPEYKPAKAAKPS